MVTFPMEEQQSYEIDAAGIVVFAILLIIALLGLIGCFVEYTPLFNKAGAEQPEVDPDVKDPYLIERYLDRMLVDSKTKLGLFFLSFSFSRNLSKILYSKQEGDANLRVLNGIRVFSMLWVMLGNSFWAVLTNPVKTNPEDVEYIEKPFLFAIVPGGFFAVDAFFYVSAFLTAVLLLEKMF